MKGVTNMKYPVSVVIADDEFAIRNSLGKIVSDFKEFDIRTLGFADNGKDAFALIKKHHPDIAIIDINMPSMDGLEVIRRAAQSNCGTRFLILSGYNDFTYAQTAIRYGVKSYFLKPLDIAEFRGQFLKQCREICVQKYGHADSSSKGRASLINSAKEMFLNKLIQNNTQRSADIDLKLSELKLSISNTWNCVVVFNLCTELSETINLEEINDFHVKNSFKKYSMESWVCDERQILSIFNIEDDLDKDFHEDLQKCLNQIKEKVSCKIIAGIGNAVPNLSQCFNSYMKAQEALSYQIYETNTDIYDTSIICTKKPAFSKESIDFEPIVNSIVCGDEAGIENYCRLFFNSLFFIKMPPPNFVVGMCMYLNLNVQSRICAIYPEAKDYFDSSIEEMGMFESAQILYSRLVDGFKAYARILKEVGGESNPIIKSAKKYIEENINRIIKAKDVAAHVNLSESYFTIYFKEKTGVNFRDYILKTKMDYAKSLIKSKKNNIGEIAYLTGYQDYRSFSRAFKNETGMSPSDYMNHAD
jgi:two-component system response regulator YesN